MATEGKIEKILEMTDEVTSVTKNNDESMEFNFKGGLVFENMAILDESEEPVEAPDLAHYDSMSEIELGQMFGAAAAAFFD